MLVGRAFIGIAQALIGGRLNGMGKRHFLSRDVNKSMCVIHLSQSIDKGVITQDLIQIPKEIYFGSHTSFKWENPFKIRSNFKLEHLLLREKNTTESILFKFIDL